MSWKEDRLYTCQPYFVIDSSDFYQKILVKDGISHFYTFKMMDGQTVRIVPDGCIDLIFGYDLFTGVLRARVGGTTTEYKEKVKNHSERIFGVRLMPGVQTSLLTVTTRDLTGGELPLEEILAGDHSLLDDMAAAATFDQRMVVFLDYYQRYSKKEEPFGKKSLVEAVKKRVYESDGRVRIHEMEKETGYSERYINMVFLDEMGFSPKTFCKIIQFQRTLKYLNYGAPEKMTDAAVMLGYYDQPQFIRNFTHYAGMTPMRYLRLIREKHYSEVLPAVNFSFREALLRPGTPS
ncbi:MAG: helix-turn-helix domain-containing protein [Lachnospiraceae bacterium]|nr:helix-turn-helix domain-containing protein [Lachnospiraceae bacterium]